MPTPDPRYRVRTKERVIGPHGLETLRQLAAMREFTEEDFVSEEGSEEWASVRSSPELHASLFPPARKFQLKDKSFHNVNAASAEPPPTIEEMLRHNLAKADGVESPLRFDDIRPSRRNRDYAFTAVLGNVLGAAALIVFPHNLFVLVFELSFFALFNAGAYWIFYHVMDRY